MAVFTSPQTQHKRGFLRSNGVEVSVFAMLAGMGVAMFLALTILGGDAPNSPVEPEVQSTRDAELPPAPETEIGGAPETDVGI